MLPLLIFICFLYQSFVLIRGERQTWRCVVSTWFNCSRPVNTLTCLWCGSRGGNNRAAFEHCRRDFRIVLGYSFSTKERLYILVVKLRLTSVGVTKIVEFVVMAPRCVDSWLLTTSLLYAIWSYNFWAKNGWRLTHRLHVLWSWRRSCLQCKAPCDYPKVNFPQSHALISVRMLQSGHPGERSSNPSRGKGFSSSFCVHTGAR
jgi:hypothetical protein